MNLSMSTIILKLHKPSSRKKSIIDEAMKNYTKAFQLLLTAAQADITSIMENYSDNTGKYRGSFLSKWVDVEMDKKLNEFGIEPFKDSIKMDFGSLIAGYLNLKKKNAEVNFPTAIISEEEMDYEYEKLMESNEAIEVIEAEIEKLDYKKNNLRPLFFCRYAINRNYSIFYNTETCRYYAKIYLMNVKNKMRKKIAPYDGDIHIYINRQKTVFKENSGKRSYEILPLAFGKWQEKYLKEAILNPEILKTARLKIDKNNYYLCVNMAKERKKVIDVSNNLGISRGINNTLNYCVVNNLGDIVQEGVLNTENNCMKLNSIHKLANNIVDLAVTFKSQVILERLIDRGDRLNWLENDGVNYGSKIQVNNYNQLAQILDYKIPDSGLPKVIRVSCINVFYTCPYCGNNSKDNRFSRELLICTSCGMTIDVERAGSLNLARKLIKYKNDKIKIIVEKTESGVKFVNKDLGFEYTPLDPYNCGDEFKEKIACRIRSFYDNINMEARKTTFKKRLSLVKKLEGRKDIFELIEIN